MWTMEENNEQPSQILLVSHTSRKCESLKSTSRLAENSCLAGMRLDVLQFLAGCFGAVSSMFLLGSLGSDYWLLASESCEQGDAAVSRLWKVKEDISHVQPDGSNQAENTYLFYHEGLFWRCSDQRVSNGEQESMLAFWITNQPSKKVCMLAYLSHAPLSRRTNSFLNSDFATVQRAFWCVIFMLGVISVMIGGFVTICATSGTSHRLYEAGGALFITGGVLIWSVVLLFAVWVHVSDSLERYGLQRRRLVCPSLQLSVHYGPSFMLAPTAAFFCLLTGVLLLLISSVSRASVRQTEKQPFSVREERV
ncbi:transmembrane protein 182-like isoform X1 [Xyrauchen texanus]|uniref:transmembrane protein 182-like isoform X1 n=1 Tax=Xyrauchen texanus TaxID=154827 RepID=UPI002242223E|nr:transmembrane protein 182-like isoform X1 [Xyrauchen texanus]